MHFIASIVRAIIYIVFFPLNAVFLLAMVGYIADFVREIIGSMSTYSNRASGEAELANAVMPLLAGPFIFLCVTYGHRAYRAGNPRLAFIVSLFSIIPIAISFFIFDESRTFVPFYGLQLVEENVIPLLH